ncbi:hypothetical protein TPA0598_13_00440 [Streptomyces lydicamycinicus]|uniref:Uncharacterized protein n=1 Tax=Streptomyces lydicamycinicus TaxID=1546107 RepID=A0A0P4RHK2_9ACTN|nr:hypothetical protein TPA0598_13_00440 [Streptomyces lydicamycinicus]
MGGARNALETVGPAAGYAAKFSKPSAVGPTLSTASGKAASVDSAAVTYPDPPRSMSLRECKAHMGGDAPYYLKSRFSVCTALRITQVWTSSRGRAGASSLTFYIRASVPKDTSRTINFDWDVTDFAKGRWRTASATSVPSTPRTTELGQVWRHLWQGLGVDGRSRRTGATRTYLSSLFRSCSGRRPSGELVIVSTGPGSVRRSGLRPPPGANA